MTKITYYLGAGASYNSCPILNRLSEAMIEIASFELEKRSDTGSRTLLYEFIDDEKETLPDDNRIKILWHIGYFGKKGILFNTIDTYARKLELTKDITQLDILKMCISVFFDLWEEFSHSRYQFIKVQEDNKAYESIDYRYKSLFSILLRIDQDKIKLDENINFISWNYDLQLESTFKLFLKDDAVSNFDELNDEYVPFKENNPNVSNNKIYHLNGHRGYHSRFDFKNVESKDIGPRINNSIDEYWSANKDLFSLTVKQDISLNKHIKYAWEHNLKSNWIENISKTLAQTEILVIIGYSFPPFNRDIDQQLFASLNSPTLKKIIFQDPNADAEIIKNLFKTSPPMGCKIIIENNNMSQFFLPNEYFIRQKSGPFVF